MTATGSPPAVIPSLRRREPGCGGQSLVETAIAGMLLVYLSLGVYSLSELIAVENVATTASRAGARLAAQLGNDNYEPGISSIDPTTVDQQVVATARAPFTGPQSPPGTTPQEVDIYEPMSADGQYRAGDLIDRYYADGTSIDHAPLYTLDKRNQTLGQESRVGVRLVINFTAPTALFPFLSGVRSEFTVMQLSPA